MPDASLRNLAGYIGRGLFFFIGKKGASANYVHVDNVVEALLLCATHEAARNQAFNLCDGFTMEELVAAIARSLGCRVPRMRMPEQMVRTISRVAGRLMGGFPLSEERIAGLTNRTVYAADAIREQLGYRPPVSLEEGIAELLGTGRDPGASRR
jgi:nucleoside-diphosphate-sugar epimerase